MVGPRALARRKVPTSVLVSCLAILIPFLTSSDRTSSRRKSGSKRRKAPNREQQRVLLSFLESTVRDEIHRTPDGSLLIREEDILQIMELRPGKVLILQFIF